MRSLTIIVPFYNESRTLRQLVKQIGALPKDSYEQVIFVNDGSEDDSDKVLKDALQDFAIPHQHINKKNGGKASAVIEGLAKSETTHAVILDADLELEVSDLIGMWKLIESEKAEAVFGYRDFKAHSSYTYRYAVGNKLISNFYGIVFNQLITDIMCGYKVFPVKLSSYLPKKVYGYSIEIAIPSALWQVGLKPYEVEVSYKPRQRHEGKIINVLDAVKVLLSIIRFRRAVRAHKI